MLKAIGALWENDNPKSKTRYSGKIDLGALGEVDVKVFDNEKQDEKRRKKISPKVPVEIEL